VSRVYLNYDEAVERFVVNWWQDHNAEYSFPADLNRHPHLAALSAQGVIYDPVDAYWPAKGAAFKGLFRRQLDAIQGHASWAAGTVVKYLERSPKGVHFSDDDLERFRLSAADVTMGGAGFDDFRSLGLPKLTELPRPVEHDYDHWRSRAGYLPPAFKFTPARTGYINSREVGLWVLFGNRGVNGKALVLGVQVPKRVDAYRKLPVAEWRGLAKRYYEQEAKR
jgi:hypothetical protein